jgi:hypothetical protein
MKALYRAMFCLGVMFLMLLSTVSIGKSKTLHVQVENIVGRSLSEPDVQDFLSTVTTTPPRHFAYGKVYYRIYDVDGIELICDGEDRITTVFLYSGSSEGKIRFRGRLPKNLQFSDTRAMIAQRLGMPDCAGGGGEGVSGKVNIWERYQTDACVLHITYGSDGCIKMVTLMSASTAPPCGGDKK